MHLIKNAFIIILLFITSSVRAEYFVINDYKVNMTVLGQKGIIMVDEYITVEFSEPRRGIFRKIPYIYMIDGKETEFSINKVIECDNLSSNL